MAALGVMSPLASPGGPRTLAVSHVVSAIVWLGDGLYAADSDGDREQGERGGVLVDQASIEQAPDRVLGRPVKISCRWLDRARDAGGVPNAARPATAGPTSSRRSTWVQPDGRTCGPTISREGLDVGIRGRSRG
jgi:hypothetical protein